MSEEDTHKTSEKLTALSNWGEQKVFSEAFFPISLIEMAVGGGGGGGGVVAPFFFVLP